MKYLIKTLSLKSQAILIVVLIIIIPSIVIGFISANMSTLSTKKSLESYSTRVLGQLCGNIDMYMTDMGILGIKISENSDVQRTLKSNYSSDSTSEYYQNQARMMSFLNGLNFVRTDISGIYLYNTQEIIYYKRGENVFTRPVLTFGKFNLEGQEWFDDLQESNDVMTIVGPGYVRMDNKTDYSVFSVARKVLISNSNESIGYLLINMDINKIESICNNVLLGEGDTIVVFDGNGKVVYSTSLIDKIKIEEFLYKDLKKNPGRLNSVEINGKKMLAFSSDANFSKWSVVQLFDREYVYKNANTYVVMNIIGTLITSLLAIVLLLIVVKRVIRPVSKISESMKYLESGNFGIEVKAEGNDEINQLFLSFNSMSKRLKTLINEVYESKLKARDAHMSALQNQINPHFLYNTLESIHMMAEINGDSTVAKMVSSLGKYFRYCIKGGEIMATLGEELEFVNNYVTVQKIRFLHKFKYFVFTNEDLLCKRIPRLIIQPIIENCIVHGFDSSESGFFIMVSAFSKDDTFYISIADNGMGIDETTMSQISYECEHETPFLQTEKINKIGISNINMRIKTLYGESFGLKVVSIMGVGTEVILSIPVNRLEA